MNRITNSILTILFLLGALGFGQYHLNQRLEHIRAEAQHSGEINRQRMASTTAQLDQIRDGVERITGDTLELANRIDGLSDRIIPLEANQ